MKKIHCTVSERILLHLLDYIHENSESTVTSDITQQGIADTICVQQKHIPRSLKKLKDQQLITEQKNHVMGKKQMMKTYGLTPAGRSEAIRIKNSLTDQHISFIHQGKKCMKSILDVHNHFNGEYSYACIVSQVCKHSFFLEKNIIESQHTEEALSKKLSPEYIYQKALEEAWKDGVLSVDERNILKKLRSTLDISDTVHYQLQRKILQSKHFSSNEIYRHIYDLVLTEVLKDNKISKDEQAILERLKKHFNIKE